MPLGNYRNTSGGACKNIIAIACGIIEGREPRRECTRSLGDAGLTEIARLGCAMGGNLKLSVVFQQWETT